MTTIHYMDAGNFYEIYGVLTLLITILLLWYFVRSNLDTSPCSKVDGFAEYNPNDPLYDDIDKPRWYQHIDNPNYGLYDGTRYRNAYDNLRPSDEHPYGSYKNSYNPELGDKFFPGKFGVPELTTDDLFWHSPDTMGSLPGLSYTGSDKFFSGMDYPTGKNFHDDPKSDTFAIFKQEAEAAGISSNSIAAAYAQAYAPSGRDAIDGNKAPDSKSKHDREGFSGMCNINNDECRLNKPMDVNTHAYDDLSQGSISKPMPVINTPYSRVMSSGRRINGILHNINDGTSKKEGLNNPDGTPYNDFEELALQGVVTIPKYENVKLTPDGEDPKYSLQSGVYGGVPVRFYNTADLLYAPEWYKSHQIGGGIYQRNWRTSTMDSNEPREAKYW